MADISILATPWWIRAIFRLHVTYVIRAGLTRMFPPKNAWRGLDARIVQERYADNYVQSRQRTKEAEAIESDLADGNENDDLHNRLTIFIALMEQWETLAKANGATFTIVLLPQEHGQGIKNLLNGWLVVLNLLDEFEEIIPDYGYEKLRFQNDGHWAEATNRLAAVFLYTHIERLRGRSTTPWTDIETALAIYHSAFRHGWQPAKVADTPESEQAKIRSRDVPLENVDS